MSFQADHGIAPGLTPGALRMSAKDRETTRRRLIGVLSGSFQFEPHRLLTWALEAFLRQIGCRQFTDLPPEKARGEVKEALNLYLGLMKYSYPFEDLWGPVYMELASKGQQKWMGQFFTPYPIARMMAEMMLDDGRESADGRLITACDPASGSGVMMLAMAQSVLMRHGREALAQYSFTCVDLDPICALMSAVQLMANVLVHDLTLGEVVVMRGDSLGLQENLDLVIHASRPDVPVAPADHPNRLEAIRQAAETSLFPWYQEVS